VTEIAIYIFISLVLLSFEWKLLKHLSLFKRTVGLGLLLLILLALLPPLLSWQKQREISHKDQFLGWVLWDRSSSFEFAEQQKLELQEKLEQAKIGDIEWMEFSDELLPPLGQGEVNGGSDLNGSLKSLVQEWELQSPDWIWVISDGGFGSRVELPSEFKGEKLFYSQIDREQKELDFGLTQITSDPVWYTRTESPLHVSVFRNQSKGEDEVDLICRLNGVMMATTKARFKDGESETIAQFTVSSDRLGPVYVEVMFAEGQGGVNKKNDHLLEVSQVIRDSVRVLRVVGRPSWSSKFLRDQLVKREDVDLIDFHILRSIRDRTMASTEELALIPFPVEELFVENINSFDLVIWQNFDYENYPFFKPVYLRNIVKYVQNGGSLLLWAGTQPWQLQTGILSELAPLSNRGQSSSLVSGDFRIPQSSLLPESFKQILEPMQLDSLRVFQGQAEKDAQTHMSYADVPVLLSKEYGRGRVLQMASDEFWNVAFNGPGGANELYGRLLKHALLWLQHHPDVEMRELELADKVRLGSSLKLTLPPKTDSPILNWKGVSVDSQLQQSLDLGKQVQTTQVPDRPGVYEVKVGETGLSHRIGVGYPSNEFFNQALLDEVPEKIEKLGFQLLDVRNDLPKPKQELKPLMRTTGIPWHTNWPYLLGVVLLIAIHWIYLNRSLKIMI
jgi:hypothetical protein